MKLINTINGRSAECSVEVPGYSACYAQHADLMKWARRTGCSRLLHRIWHGDGSVEPFISVVAETVCGFAVYRNPPEYFYSASTHGYKHFHRSYVKKEDELAFFAEEVEE